VLDDPQLARANFDLLTNYSDSVVGLITRPASTARAQLAADWNALLERFAADADVSTAERLNVIAAQVALARLQSPKGELSATLLQTVREQVARADAESQDPYTRQVVIDAAAGLLAEAGAMPESDALLTAELSRSHSPYYFMLDLASNALKRGDKAQAIAWNEKAYAAARGPATRLQWGVHYVTALIDLTPQDARRIEATAQSVIGEIDPTPDTFYERNRRGLERMGKKLVEWNKRHQHDTVLAHVRSRMAAVCVKLPAEDPARATCNAVFRPASASA
jgi:hypothetical protein